MAEENFIQSPPEGTESAVQPVMAPQRGRGRAVLAAALIAFLLGAAAVGYAAWQGLVPLQRDSAVRLTSPASEASSGPAAEAIVRSGAPEGGLAAHQDELEGRMAALEVRLDALVGRADAAASHASRAEALLVAFAARRAVDRGAALGPLEDQLRLRFGDAQPNAVGTVIAAGRTPVTLDQLLAGLDSLAPSLTQAPATASAWTKLKRELSGLFVIRRDTAPSPLPQVMLNRARVLLEAGQTEDAIAEVRRLPGAGEAGEWFAAARRFDGAHRALDVLETAALLDTDGLKDADGKTVHRAGPAVPLADRRPARLP